MEQNDRKEMEPAQGTKQSPQVSGTSEAHTKQQTKPLGQGDARATDQEEGSMNNGEVGAESNRDAE